MKIVFGPVSSRRFGLSLGVDLSPTMKQCNFDCVYCELSAKKAQAKQDSIVSVGQILSEVKEYLKKDLDFDFLTLTANGEPSLYPHLDELIIKLKELLSDKKILILSNGSAVLDESKFQSLLKLDVVKFSLDSANEKTFFRIDKALKDIDLNLMIEKMAEFRAMFKGDLIMEVLVVEKLNDSEFEFELLNKAFAKIKPLRVDLSTIDRPPAYPVKGVSEQRLKELSAKITSVPLVLARHTYKEQKIDFSEEELLKMLNLRSQSEFDIEAKFSESSKNNLKNLLQSGKITVLDLAGVKFYKTKELFF